MVNVRCQACQAKYRLLAAKRVDLFSCFLLDPGRAVGRPAGRNPWGKSDPWGKADPWIDSLAPAPRFPYRPPIQRRPRSYILPPVHKVLADLLLNYLLNFFIFVVIVSCCCCSVGGGGELFC